MPKPLALISFYLLVINRTDNKRDPLLHSMRIHGGGLYLRKAFPREPGKPSTRKCSAHMPGAASHAKSHFSIMQSLPPQQAILASTCSLVSPPNWSTKEALDALPFMNHQCHADHTDFVRTKVIKYSVNCPIGYSNNACHSMHLLGVANRGKYRANS